MSIAYAYNEYIPYAPEIAFTASSAYTPSNAGQKKQKPRDHSQEGSSFQVLLNHVLLLVHHI